MSSERAAPGLLLVLSAPSGAGKTTLAHRFRARHADAVFSVSATTRPPRGAERDGVDYHFVSPARFAELVAQGAFAEWAEVHGQRYGTLCATVDEALRAGRIALFDIDVQGGAQLRRAFPRDAVTVFIVPPTAAELERRLRGRSTDSEEVIARRLAAARAEVAEGVASYDYVVVNDEIDSALTQLEAIVAHERARRGGEADPEAGTVAERCRAGAADLRAWQGQERS
jgi:guanylate kinase